jgi:hypothetical protein
MRAKWFRRNAKSNAASQRLAQVKKRESRPGGEGGNLAFAGIFSLMRRELRAPGTWTNRRRLGCYEGKARLVRRFGRHWHYGGTTVRLSSIPRRFLMQKAIAQKQKTPPIAGRG